MSRYFNYFPKLLYTTNNTTSIVTDLLTRPALIQDILDNTSLYYEYDVQEGDTPEIVASRYYGDAELHWVILIVNQITDPFYDWPMSYQQFVAFINEKYGSQANALELVHHYERINTSIDGGSKQSTVGTYSIPVTIPFRNLGNVDTFSELPVDAELGDAYQTLDTELLYVWDGVKWFVELAFNEYNSIIESTTTKAIGNTTVTETISKQEVRCFDYENTLNESKRTIKLIKSSIIADVKNQFINLMKA
jgi:hypothetical protein